MVILLERNFHPLCRNHFRRQLIKVAIDGQYYQPFNCLENLHYWWGQFVEVNILFINIHWTSLVSSWLTIFKGHFMLASPEKVTLSSCSRDGRELV